MVFNTIWIYDLKKALYNPPLFKAESESDFDCFRACMCEIRESKHACKHGLGGCKK
jgi:hypothetical protein